MAPVPRGSEPAIEESGAEAEPDATDRAPVPCPDSEGLIDDMEDADARSHLAGGRGGLWSSYVDDVGSTMHPPSVSPSGRPFAMATPGARGSRYAARLHGKLASATVVYAGMQVNFVGHVTPYDASRYDGIAFWAKKAAGTSGRIHVMVSDRYTLLDGGVCTECYNHFGIELELSEDWKEYAIPFATLRQRRGWGKPRPEQLAQTAIYGLIFQVSALVTGAGADYDFWVDDIRFTGCGG